MLIEEKPCLTEVAFSWKGQQLCDALFALEALLHDPNFLFG